MKQTKPRGSTGAELIKRWIVPNPNKPGKEEAVIRDYYVPVWALIGYLPMVNAAPEQLASGFDLPLEAVEAALAYYARYKAFIDVRLAQNAAGGEE